jgi:hypothetical protein
MDRPNIVWTVFLLRAQWVKCDLDGGPAFGANLLYFCLPPRPRFLLTFYYSLGPLDQREKKKEKREKAMGWVVHDLWTTRGPVGPLGIGDDLCSCSNVHATASCYATVAGLW